MRTALRGAYVEFVFYMGMTERYPEWFHDEILGNLFKNSERYTFWVPKEERNASYYDKELIEDYSVFIRKEDGDIHLTDYDTFSDLYCLFCHNAFTNSGVAALDSDCIDYVEVTGGEILDDSYPSWFYEYFTEAIVLPTEETVLIRDSKGDVTVKYHSVFLKNRHNEIREMLYSDFIKYYDPQPEVGIWSVVNFHKYYPKLYRGE